MMKNGEFFDCDNVVVDAEVIDLDNLPLSVMTSIMNGDLPQLRNDYFSHKRAAHSPGVEAIFGLHDVIEDLQESHFIQTTALPLARDI